MLGLSWKRTLIIVLIAAFILTLVTSQIKYYDDFQGVSTQADAQDVVKGFPFAFTREAASSVILTSPENISLYKTIAYSYLFWTAGAIALFLLKKGSFKTVGINVFWATALALTLMQIYLSSQSSCMKGFPIKFFSICGGPSPNNPAVFFAILDLFFWLVTGFVVVVLIKAVKRLPKLFVFEVSYFLMPLILTSLSVVNYVSCSGFFCFGPSGRGFPIYYLIDSYPASFKFNLKYFIIDYVFWFILYILIKVVWSLGRYIWKKIRK